MDIIVLALLGVVTGAISALFGIGGGMVIVPAMLYFNHIIPNMQFSTHDAVGISVMQMIFSSFFGTYINMFRKKNLDIKNALFLGVGGAIGAYCSGFLLDIIDTKHLTLVFLLVSCATFYKFLFGSKPKPIFSADARKNKGFVLALIGMITGVFAISLGIGGGILLTPLLMYYLGFDTKKIVPMSLFFIALSSVSGVISFARHDIFTSEVSHAGLTIGICSLIGVLIGQKLMDKISPNRHKAILVFLYTISIAGTCNKVLQYYGVFS